MVVLRQRIATSLEFEGKAWRLTITREFALRALVRRRISDSEFFDFIDRQRDTIALIAKREIMKLALRGDDVVLDRYDLPE